MRKWVLWWGAWWMVVGCLGVAHACRYSVRDTGFVDLGAGGYWLEWHVPGDFPGGWKKDMSAAASAVLAESNVQWEVKEARPGEGSRLRLVDAQGRSLEAGTARPGDDPFRLLEFVVTSPARERVLRECLRGYAVVLLVEGTDAGMNGRAREAVRAAIDGVARLIPGMPKPVEVPPQLVVVAAAEVESERILLWGLGLEPGIASEPRLALLYGRGRRLGTPLEGPMITATTLRERLVLVGQDCECDLDREWLRGPLIPARWDAAMQQVALRTLGFDPENPMIRAEVSRIVERGPVDGQKRKMAGTSQALGYSEDSVEAEPAKVGEPVLEAAPRGSAGLGRAGEAAGWAWGVAGVAGALVVAGAGWILWKGGRG